MRRRELICFLGGGLLCPSVAFAQQSANQAKIGWLFSIPPAAKFLQATRQRLEQLGHVEGRDIAIVYRSADSNLDRLPSLAAELVDQKVNVIVTLSTPATVAARKVTSAIPIVMIGVSDQVGRALVDSLARPGGNVTGLAFGVELELFSKSLELLKEAVPGLLMVALLVNPANPAHAAVVSRIEPAALALNIRSSVFRARRPEEIATAFEAIARASYGAVFVVAEQLFNSEAAQIATLALKYHLPSMHQFREQAEAGGLMSYGPDSKYMFRRAATYVDAILKGAKPADLPIGQPTKFELVINLKTARTLGLTISPTLLVRADEVIE